jgi:hypothetical protein
MQPKYMTKNEILTHLFLRGQTLRGWARAHGYKPGTVDKVVARWAGCQDEPQGRLSYRILRDLSVEMGREIVPGLLRQAA